MIIMTRTAIAVLALTTALAGCGGSETGVPLAPSVVPPTPPAPPPGPARLVVFTDPASGFATSDVRDVDDEIARFNTASELIWSTDDTRFAGYRVSGDQIRGPGPEAWFQVRFGTKNGERRAYLGWSDDFCHCPDSPPTIIDIEVVNGQLVVTATDARVPGS